MSFTYDFTSAPALSQLRLMVGDTDSTQPIFQDAEVNAALQANSSQGIIVGLAGFTPTNAIPQIFSYGRAAALLLNSIGATKARLIVKGLLDINIDGAAAAQALQKLGQQYIDQEVSGGFFAVSEMVLDPFSMRERLWKMLYRQNN